MITDIDKLRQTEIKRIITIKEAAQFINMSIGNINRLIKKNKIPSYKKGGRRLFDREELICWLKGMIK